MIIVIIACYFTLRTFTFSEVGSIGNLYDLVKAAGARNPVSGNAQGTYLTMTSKDVRAYHPIPISVQSLINRRLLREGDSLWHHSHMQQLWFGRRKLTIRRNRQALQTDEM